MNRMFKTLFITVIITSLTPLYIALYHLLKYTGIEKDYIAGLTTVYTNYMIILTAGLTTISLSLIFMYKPMIIPKPSLKLSEKEKYIKLGAQLFLSHIILFLGCGYDA